MFRQIRNLRHLGRIRTSPKSVRVRKPQFLRDHRKLELTNPLELVARYASWSEDYFQFVQIGAFDGLRSDPLHGIINNYNWRGILVEPQARAFEKLIDNCGDNPDLKLFNVAIGPSDGELILYSRKSGPVSTASTNRNFLITPRHGEEEIIAEKVECWTFETLLEKAGAPARIDLLQIDTEGFDFEIIRSIDFGRTLPGMIRYEHVLLSETDKNACLEYLAYRGYRFLLEDMDTTAILMPDSRAVSSR